MFKENRSIQNELKEFQPLICAQAFKDSHNLKYHEYILFMMHVRSKFKLWYSSHCQ